MTTQLTFPFSPACDDTKRRNYHGYLQVYGWKGIDRWIFLVPWFDAHDDNKCTVCRFDGTADKNVRITDAGSLKIAGRYFGRDRWDH